MMLLTELATVWAVFNATLNPFGYEGHPFPIKCYNNIKTMDPKFHLNYTDNTLALTLIAGPDTFEKAIKPFICDTKLDSIKGSTTGQTNLYYLNKFIKKYPDTDFLSSYVMLGPKHPQILSQTAAHVSGAAYYYQRRDVHIDPWPKNKTIFGHAIHPRYGGFIRIPGVIVFKNIQLPEDDICPTPPDVLPTDEMKIEMLNEVNTNWKSWKFASISHVEKNYTSEAIKYFSTYGAERKSLIKKIKRICEITKFEELFGKFRSILDYFTSQ
ncbi:methylmalonic aciduria and homocystinuria type C protein homolog isoform X2 [Argonauta hians]